MLNSADAVIDAAGGTGAVSRLVGVGMPAVSNWRERNSIPSRFFVVISSELSKRGVEVDPAVFRMEEARA